MATQSLGWRSSGSPSELPMQWLSPTLCTWDRKFGDRLEKISRRRRLLLLGAGVQTSENMTFSPGACSQLSLTHCPPGPGCDGSPPRAQLRLFPPNQARRRHLFGRAVPAKSPHCVHSSVSKGSVLSSLGPLGCHLRQPQGWPGSFGSLPGAERERHALWPWKFPAKSQEQILMVSASLASGSWKPHSLSLGVPN